MDRSGEVRFGVMRSGMMRRLGSAWCGTKGASMNQIMVNAVEFDSLLKEVEYLKHENQKLKEQLKDTQDRIRVLKEEVGFAERGYTKL
jgi:cell division protein FtsB